MHPLIGIDRCTDERGSVAGDQVTVEMHQQPGDRSCANEAIGGDHYGPINVSLQRSQELPRILTGYPLDLHGKG